MGCIVTFPWLNRTIPAIRNIPMRIDFNLLATKNIVAFSHENVSKKCEQAM